jgi:hypothetical protein
VDRRRRDAATAKHAGGLVGWRQDRKCAPSARAPALELGRDRLDPGLRQGPDQLCEQEGFARARLADDGERRLPGASFGQEGTAVEIDPGRVQELREALPRAGLVV